MWKVKSVRLRTDLDLEDCVLLLKENVGSSWGLGSGAWVVGRVGRNHFTIRCDDHQRAHLKPRLFGTLKKTNHGCQIDCEIGFSEPVKVFMAVATLAFVSAFLMLAYDLVVGGFNSNADFSPLLLILFSVLPISPYLLMRVAAIQSSDDPETLLSFVRSTLEAEIQ